MNYYVPPAPAIIQPWHSFRSAAAVISASVSVANATAAMEYRKSGRGMGHLGERQRVNLYKSRGGGRRSRR